MLILQMKYFQYLIVKAIVISDLKDIFSRELFQLICWYMVFN